MPTVELKPRIKLDIDEILNGIAALDTSDLENFHLKVGGLLSSRKAKSIPDREHALVKKITGAFLPAQKSKRFEELFQKQESSTLSGEEKTEYQYLLQLVQNKSLQRLAWLVELCQLRGEPISQTMEKLGIQAVNPYNG